MGGIWKPFRCSLNLVMFLVLFETMFGSNASGRFGDTLEGFELSWRAYRILYIDFVSDLLAPVGKRECFAHGAGRSEEVFFTSFGNGKIWDDS